MPYLTAWSVRSIQPGNSIAALVHAEQRLGQKLPWELWELYRCRHASGYHATFHACNRWQITVRLPDRYRNGQAPHTGVELVEGSRMLGCAGRASCCNHVSCDGCAHDAQRCCVILLLTRCFTRCADFTRQLS